MSDYLILYILTSRFRQSFSKAIDPLAVPEAAVDEDGEFAGDVGDVRADGERTTPSAWRRHPSLVRRGVKGDPAMQAVTAKAGVPEGFAEREFRSGVPGAVGAHDARDGFGLGRGRSFVADVVDT